MTTDRTALRVASAVALLVVGGGAGLAAVLLHQRGWGLALGLLTALTTTIALPPGWWSRLPFMLGWMAAVLVGLKPRPEGDYLIPADAAGYLLLGGSFGVLLLALATSGPVREGAGDPGDRGSPT